MQNFKVIKESRSPGAFFKQSLFSFMLIVFLVFTANIIGALFRGIIPGIFFSIVIYCFVVLVIYAIRWRSFGSILIMTIESQKISISDQVFQLNEIKSIDIKLEKAAYLGFHSGPGSNLSRHHHFEIIINKQAERFVYTIKPGDLLNVVKALADNGFVYNSNVVADMRTYKMLKYIDIMFAVVIGLVGLVGFAI